MLEKEEKRKLEQLREIFLRQKTIEKELEQLLSKYPPTFKLPGELKKEANTLSRKLLNLSSEFDSCRSGLISSCHEHFDDSHSLRFLRMFKKQTEEEIKTWLKEIMDRDDYPWIDLRITFTPLLPSHLEYFYIFGRKENILEHLKEIKEIIRLLERKGKDAYKWEATYCIKSESEKFGLSITDIIKYSSLYYFYFYFPKKPFGIEDFLI